MSTQDLIPTKGCWVRPVDSTDKKLGHVIQCREASEYIELKVNWPSCGKQEWIPLSNLKSGFQNGWTVQDVPVSTTRKSFGEGLVVGQREIGGREQVLVQLYESGQSIWFPYENVRRIKDVQMRYVKAEARMENHAERLRLKILAHALENWNHLTGALDRLDVDPLPHQIQLVHKILHSGNYNWLIADDVGLGKTIEVGLLLAALKRKKRARRVLIITPAGLVRQWQDEMKSKFEQEYLIYKHDFEINDLDHWKRYEQVIMSIDLAKREKHKDKLQFSGGWDIIIFDEAHKLTRYGDGKRSERYRLAEMLRPLSDSFLLLTGTPHQGYHDRFLFLLELARPDLRPQIYTLESNPEIVSDIILRNRKSEVTDLDGNFIFKKQRIHRISVEPSEQTIQFQKLLQVYLREGYKSSEREGSKTRAIGFVMTVYRKMASSSIAAIGHALRLRLQRLHQSDDINDEGISKEISIEDLFEDENNQDEVSENILRTGAKEFFVSEEEKIRQLLEIIPDVHNNDEKMRTFFEKVIDPLREKGKKILIFTEYRATQSYLQDSILERYGDLGKSVLINGSMSLDEKTAAIEEFEGTAHFMISTEAGGEGLNLHRKCHCMVNYDLPWNPARLVQRIGRLYRYGQQHPVLVFNLHATDTFDNSMIDLMLERVFQIAQHMAPVSDEFNDSLHKEIIGDILENIDLSKILLQSNMESEPTKQQIEEAIERAQEIKGMQDEIFSHIRGYDSVTSHGTLGFTMQHIEVFIRGMLPLLGIEIRKKLHGGEVLEIVLPEELQGKFPKLGQRRVLSITTDRSRAREDKKLILLDFEDALFCHLIEKAKSQGFEGVYASVLSPANMRGLLSCFKLRWQNDQGQVDMEEFLTLLSNENGEIEANPAHLASWLCSPVISVPVPNEDSKSRHNSFEKHQAEAHRHLEKENSKFKHPNGIIPIVAADCFVEDK